MSTPATELVEVVDPDGSVVGVVPRSAMRSGRLRHRATFVAVVSGDGRLLVHRRSPHKDVWPSRWDIAAGGVAGVGESWTDAAHRELGEELGIDGTLEPLGGGVYEDEDVATLGEVFVVRHDGPVTFDDGEVVEAHWVTLDDLEARLATDDFCPDSLVLVLPRIRALLR